jgi:sugar phosphate isomerase/epimerase
MKFGVCGGPELARIARDAGYDYFEWSVGGLLKPREDERAFEAALAEARAVGLPCPALNVFIPADLKITGPAVDMPALEAYVSTALRRAGQAGVQAIVFGSGGARRIPDGFDRAQAWDQLVAFARMLAPLAARHAVVVVVEPLNLGECNVLTTVGESAGLVWAVDHPNLRLLVDGYHWAKDGDTLAGIVDNGHLLAHAHVAAVEGRRAPSPRDTCAPFFSALRLAGYDGRVSIEGSLPKPAEELPRALEIMRSLAHG